MRKVIIAVSVLAVAGLAYCADVVLGKIGDLTFSGSGTTFVGSFGAQGWADPTTNLVLHEMETTNTTQILDTSGNAFNASNIPSVAAGPVRFETGTNQYGRTEHAYRFSGTERFFIPEDAQLDLTNRTVMAWVYLRTHPTGGAFDTVVMKVYNYWLFVGSGGLTGDDGACFGWYTGAVWAFADSGSALPTNEWIHMAGVYDVSATLLSVYTNGILADTTVASSTPQDLNSGVTIGAWTGAGAHPMDDGDIDDVRIYNYVVPSNQIYEVFQNTHPTNNIRIRP